LLEQILDAAIRAPSAGNAQNWAFILVRDAQLRGALGAIYRKASRIADAMYAARGRPAHLSMIVGFGMSNIFARFDH
jgi:nitroreductase